MAEKLGLQLGKKVIYTTSDANGEIVSEIARVTGLFETGVKQVDGAMVLLPIDSVRTTLKYGVDEANIVAVIVKDQRYTESMKKYVEQQVDNEEREVLSWKETQPDLAGILAIDRSGNYISQILVGLLIAAGILNTLLMSVMERTKEFGVMMAIGMSPRRLFQLVITESVWLALVGLIIGVIITIPWYLYLYHVGLDFSEAIGEDYSAGSVIVDPIFRIRLYKESIIAILTGVFSLTLVSGLYPAWRATQTAPVESLKTL
jgi:ABC-type lipoprotein release transport system permease subunit